MICYPEERRQAEEMGSQKPAVQQSRCKVLHMGRMGWPAETFAQKDVEILVGNK